MITEENKIAIAERQITGFDWYRLTELSSHILNSLIVRYGTAIIKEEAKPKPDLSFIHHCNEEIDYLQALRHDPANFESIESMEAIIDKYGTILKGEDDRA